MSVYRKITTGIKAEVMVAITAALVQYGYSLENGYQINNVIRIGNPWRKAGIVELMMSRELNREFL